MNWYKLKVEKRPFLAKQGTGEVKTKLIDRNRHEFYTKTHPLKLIISLSIAPFFVILANAVYALSDSFLTALLTDDKVIINGEASSLATIAINVSIIAWVPGFGVVIGIVQGSLAWFTKSQGMQDPKKMGVYNSSAFTLMILGTLIASLTLVGAGRGLIELSVNIESPIDKARIVDEAFRYISPRLASMVLIGSYIYMVRALRTLNVKWKSIIPYITAIILNLLLDYLFIKFGKLGIFGSGLATAVSDVAAVSLVSFFFLNALKKEPKEVRLFNPSVKAMKEIFILGAPNILNNWIRALIQFFLIRWSSQIGAVGVASALRVIDTWAISPGFAFIQGALIALGYAFGRKDYFRVQRLTVWLMYITATYYLFFTFILFFIGGNILDLLQIVEPRGLEWIRLTYILIPLACLTDGFRAYFTATHQKLKSFLVLIIPTVATIPFFYYYGNITKDVNSYWFAYIWGDLIQFVALIIPLMLLWKRQLYMRKHNKPPLVRHLVLEKTRIGRKNANI